MSKPPKLVNLFPTPLIVDELDDADALNSQLERTILAKMEIDEGIQRSNKGGWHSKPDFLNWSGSAGQRLAHRAAVVAGSNTTDAKAAAGELHWQVEGWANVSKGGDSNAAHFHGGSFWSAVYYVRVGEAPGGRLIFHDPRMPALRMHAPNLRFKVEGSEEVALFKPRAGRLVLFPSWLQHSVEPWGGEDVRISIAMNLRAARRSPAQSAQDEFTDQGNNDAAI